MPGTKLGTAYVQVIPSADGIKGSLTNLFSGESENAGKSGGLKFVGAMKKVIAAAGIGIAVKKALDIGGDLQQSYIGGLETLYGNAAQAARNYADEAYKAGISMNSYSEQAVSFGAALKSAYGGDVLKAAEAANTAIMDMADNSAKMGTDISSVQAAYQGFAKQNYTMLDNLKLGYGGTKSEMERLLKKANELNAEQGKITNYSIDNLGDVYEAIHVVQEDLGLTRVAAQEASETLSGSFGAMKAAAENFAGNLALGQNVEESMRGLLQTASTFFFNNLLPMIGTLIKSLPGAIATFMKEGIPLLLENILSFVSDIASGVSTFADNITGEKVTEWAKTTGVEMLKKGGELLLNFVTGLLENIDVLLDALGRIGLEIVTGLGAAIWPKVVEAANGIKERFLTVLHGLWEGVKETAANIRDGFMSKVNSIKDQVKETANSIKERFLTPINNLRDKIKEIVDKIKGFFSFSISAPHIPLPHFSLNPSGWKLGDLLQGSIPSLGISWYDKAMDEPRLFTKATLFGAGETGDEVMYGKTNLLRDIKAAAGGDQLSDKLARKVDELETKMDRIIDLLSAGHTLNINGERMAAALALDMDAALGSVAIRKERG